MTANTYDTAGLTAVTKTLDGSNADVVTVERATDFEIFNQDTTAGHNIWVNTQGTASVDGNNCVLIPPNSSMLFRRSGGTVSVFAANASKYTFSRYVDGY